MNLNRCTTTIRFSIGFFFGCKNNACTYLYAYHLFMLSFTHIVSNISEGPTIYPQHVYSRSPVTSTSGSDTLPVRGRHFGSRSSFGPSSSSGRPPRQHVSFSGNLEYLGESTTDPDVEFPPPPPDVLQDPVERNFSTFGSPTPGQSNSYRSVLHSRLGGSHGYGGVSTSLVKKNSSPTVSGGPTPPPGADGSRQRWGSPSLTNDDDDRTTTSTTSGSYVLNHEDLPRDTEDFRYRDMIV